MKTSNKILLIGLSLAIILILAYYGLIFFDTTETYRYDIKYVYENYTIDHPDTNRTSNHKASVAIETIKTTGGLPFIKNDVYQTTAIAISPGFWDSGSGKWHAYIYVTGLGASRINGSDNKTYSLKSQNLSFISTYNNTTSVSTPEYTFAYQYNGASDVSINNIFSETNINISRHSSSMAISEIKAGANLYRLSSSNAIDELNNYTTLEYNNTTFIKKIKFISGAYFPNYPWVFRYTDTLWGDISDSGYMAQTLFALSPSEPSDLYVISTLNWGLFDKSEAIIHLKITAPPNPEKIPKEDWGKYGIYDNGQSADNITIEII